MYSVAAFLTVLPLLTTASPAWSAFDERSTPVSSYTSLFSHGLSSGTSIHFPSQADYNTSTIPRYSTWDEPTFAATIKPGNVKDLQFIVGGQDLETLPEEPDTKLLFTGQDRESLQDTLLCDWWRSWQRAWF